MNFEAARELRFELGEVRLNLLRPRSHVLPVGEPFVDEHANIGIAIEMAIAPDGLMGQWLWWAARDSNSRPSRCKRDEEIENVVISMHPTPSVLILFRGFCYETVTKLLRASQSQEACHNWW